MKTVVLLITLTFSGGNLEIIEKTEIENVASMERCETAGKDVAKKISLYKLKTYKLLGWQVEDINMRCIERFVM